MTRREGLRCDGHTPPQTFCLRPPPVEAPTLPRPGDVWAETVVGTGGKLPIQETAAVR